MPSYSSSEELQGNESEEKEVAEELRWTGVRCFGVHDDDTRECDGIVGFVSSENSDDRTN